MHLRHCSSNIEECILYMLLCIKNSLNNIPCYLIFCTMNKNTC